MTTGATENNFENVYKVKLQNREGERVTFDATPDVIETRNVTYGSLDPIHAPGQIAVFKNTTSRTFTISNARLISRTQNEADLNLRRLWLLRSWCMPRFGQVGNVYDDASVDTTSPGNYNTDLLGAPPPVLTLSAYSQGAQLGKMQHINKVPVVIQQLIIPYPIDVDYIPTLSGVPMPTLMTIDITLTETHSPSEYERFSLDNYKTGTLRNY